MKNTTETTRRQTTAAWIRSAAFATLAALMLLALTPALSMAETVGVFTKVEGRVDMLRPGAHATVAVEAGTIVSEGDIVRTKSDGKAEIVFKDDTVLDIAPGSRLRIDEYTFSEDGSREQGVISLLRGKVRSIVSKVKARVLPAAVGTSSYKVRTPTTVMGVKGTDVFVSYTRGVTEVVFREGSGFVYNPALHSDEVHLVAGQATLVAGMDMPPLTPRHVSEIELITHVHDTTVHTEGKRSGGHETGDGHHASNEKKGHHDRNSVFAYSSADDDEHDDDADWLSESDTSYRFESNDDNHDDDDGGHHSHHDYGTSDSDDDLLLYSDSGSGDGHATGPDTTAPSTSITSRPRTLDDNLDAGFTLNSDESVTYSYSLDGGAWQASSGSFTLYGLAEGRHTVDVTATDGAGNSTTVSHTWYYSANSSTKSYSGTADTAMTLNGSPMGASSGRAFNYSGRFNVIGVFDQGGWYARTSGSYSGVTPFATANVSTLYNDGSLIVGTEALGQSWSGGAITGTTLGYGADHATGVSWISAGETFGTFDPATETWSALDIGTMVGTSNLIAMLDSGLPDPTGLIPFAEVGRTALTGNDGNMSVSMRDVRFLAYSSGDVPRIWSAGSVDGTYTALPNAGDVVVLSGDGLTADFTAVKWQNNSWLSTVSGSGTYTGAGTLGGSAVTMEGAAAGSYGSGAFTGTGAGVAK